MASPHPQPLAELLRRFRRAAGLTQEELAARAGVAVGTIGALERGLSQSPHRDTLALLAEALQLAPPDRSKLEASANRQRLLSAADAAAVPLSDVSATRLVGNLPTPLTPTIGREHEEAAGVHLLRREDVRLLTLTGAPGIGKTRLALQVAADLWSDFPDGVFLVELAPISDPALVLDAILRTLGVRQEAGAPHGPLSALTAHLRTRRVLLLLDNFEQVVTAGPQVVELLQTCAGVMVLATSRIPLRVRGEHQLAVPPLALPDLAALPSAPELAQYAAIALFVQRAREVKPTFTLTETQAPAVAAICQRLDGLPLAIELAAAWVRLLSPVALLARLKQRLPLLTAGARDLPERQQTVREAIDWSHDLLKPSEQALFRRLGVFVGGWTLEAAEAVCGEPGQVAAVLSALATLVDTSLVDQRDETSGGEVRFRLLELVREYALERLEASGELEGVCTRHSEYFLSRAETLAPNATVGPGPYAVWIRGELDNLRSVLRRARDQRDSASGLRLMNAIWRSHRTYGLVAEARAWLEEFLDLNASAFAQTTVAIRAEALHNVSTLAMAQGDAIPATKAAEESLALYQQLNDRQGMGAALSLLGTIASNQGDDPGAARMLTEALALRREVGDIFGTALTLNNLGEVVLRGGEHERAAELFEESMSHFRLCGEVGGIGLTRRNLGHVARAQGNLVLARRRYVESLDQYWAKGLAAGAMVTEGVCSALESLAGILRLCDQAEDAARLFGLSAYLLVIGGEHIVPENRPYYDSDMAAIRETLGDIAFQAQWRAGQETPVEQVVLSLARVAAT